MRRILLLLSIGIITVYANVSYQSIHPLNTNSWQPKTLKAQMIEAAASSYTYSIFAPINIYSGVGAYKGNLCIGSKVLSYYSTDWQRYKIYIPAGTTYFKFTVKTIPNSIMRIRMKFRGDSNNIINQNNVTSLSYENYQTINDTLILEQETIELQGPFATNVATHVINDPKYFANRGGWLYVSIANDDYFNHSAYYAGNISNASIAASYKITDGAAFQNWLQNTTFNSADEPIDDASSMIEKGWRCSGSYYTDTVSLDHSGSDPVALCTENGGTWNTAEERCVSAQEKSCNAALGQWNTSSNTCTSKAELDCIANSTTSWYKAKSVCLYDDINSELNPVSTNEVKTFDSFIANEQGWQTGIKIHNLNTTSPLTQTIKLIDEQDANVVTYQVTVPANEIWDGLVFKYDGKVYLGPDADRTTDNIVKSATTESYHGKIEVTSDGNISQVLLSEIIALKAPIAAPGETIVVPDTPVDTGSSDHQCPTGYTYDFITGICDHGTPSSTPSTPVYTPPTPVYTVVEDNTKTCATGYAYDALLGICDKVSGSKGGNDQEVILEDDEEPVDTTKCSDGEVYNAIDGVCEIKTIVEESSLTAAVKILKEKTTVTINGYFIHYDSGIFDWIYLDKSLKYMFKLEGIDASKNEFIWSKNLADSFYGIRTLDGIQKIKFGPTKSTHPAAIAVASKEMNVDGFFAKYDTGAFGWIYTTPDGKFAAKLEGLNSDDTFKWTVLESKDTKSFNNIRINSGIDINFN